MGVFLILVGLILFMVGIFKLLNKNSNTSKKSKWLIFGAGIVVILVGTVMTGNASVAKDKTPTSAKEAKPALRVDAVKYIEQQLSVSGVTVSDADLADVIYQGARKDKQTGKIYKHVYYMNGKFELNGAEYDFNMSVNYNMNNIKSNDAARQLIQFGNTMNTSANITPDLSAHVSGAK